MRLERAHRVLARSGDAACAEALEPRTLLAAFMYTELPMLGGSGLRPAGVGDDGYIWGEYDGGFFLMLGYREAPFDQHDPMGFPGFGLAASPLEAGERIIDADVSLVSRLEGGDYTLNALVADDAAGTNPALLLLGPDVPPRRIELSGLPEFGAPAGSVFGPVRGVATNNDGDVVIERTRTDGAGTVASTWLYREGALHYVFDGSPIGINDADTIVSNGPDGHVWTWSSGVGVVDLGGFVATGFSNTPDHALGDSFVFGYDPLTPGQMMLARRPTAYPPGQGPPGAPTTPGPISLHTVGGPAGAVSVRPTFFDIAISGSYVDGTGRTHGFTTGVLDYTSGAPTTTFSDINGTILNAPAGFDAGDIEYLWSEFGTTTEGVYPDQTHTSENQVYIGRRGPDGAGFLLQNARAGKVYLSDFVSATNHNNSSPQRTLDFTLVGVPYGADYQIALIGPGGEDVMVISGVSDGRGGHVLTDGVTTLPDGVYTYELRVLVGGAVVYTEGPRTVTIDTVPPVFTSTAPTSASMKYAYDPATTDEGTENFGFYRIIEHASTPPGLYASALFSASDLLLFHPPASALGTPITLTVRAEDRAGNFADQVITFTVHGFGAFFPEGFVGETIDEFLAVVNPHEFHVNYRVTAWYEGLDGSTQVGEFSIAPSSRGGMTVSKKETWWQSPVFPGRPYALEIISEAPLITSISHYDFGSATSETFTDRLSTSWILPAGRVGPSVRDFIVWYNPGAESANVTVDFFAADGTLVWTSHVATDAYKRGGLDVDAIGLPEGGYTAVVTADRAIVASLTQYLTGEHPEGPAAFMALGVPDGGATAAALPLVLAEPTAALRIYNPAGGVPEATITLTFTDEAGSAVTHVMTLGAGLAGTLTIGEVAGLAPGARYAVAYTSDAPVAVVAVQRAHEDLVATPLIDLGAAGETFFFADGFMDHERAGIDVFETVSIYNPGAVDPVEVTVTVRFADGFALSTVLQVAAARPVFLDLHGWQDLLDQGADFGRFFYGIEISADAPILAGMWHFDLTLSGETPAGGFAVLGGPVG